MASSSDDEVEYIEEKTRQKSDVDEDDDNEESDEDQPNGAECLELCKQFAEITATDRALAMFYLQNQKWNLDRALNEFFKQTQSSAPATATAPTTTKNDDDGQKKSTASSSSRSKVVACFDVDQLDEDERRFSGKRSRVCSPPEQQVVDQHDDQQQSQHFKIMSWNIDGLDKSSLESRALGVARKILGEKPDVVLLQEVVEKNETILRNELGKSYEFSSGNRYVVDNRSKSESSPADHYYTMILSKRVTCRVESSSRHEFDNSVMGRNLLEVRLSYLDKVHMCVLTAHLESTADFARQRIDQLRECFDHINKVDKSYVVFFGGDLNLRDSELSSIGGVPKGLYDVWESTGARKECLYTWDCSRNSNLKMNSRFKPKCRFDRLYFRQSSSSSDRRVVSSTAATKSGGGGDGFTLTPVYFELEGLEKLKTCGRFCSDHWAIQAYCELDSLKVN